MLVPAWVRCSMTPSEFETKVEALCRPGIWPVSTRSVELVETHFACVFLTDHHAFKLKRPIRWHQVDLTSLERRRRACERELVLNRPLGGDVYQGTLALRRSPEGELTFTESGTVVDWLVAMTRLPAARALDRLIAADAIDEDDLERLAATLAAFYERSPTVERDPAHYLARIARTIADDLETISGRVDGVPNGLVESISAAQRRFLDEDAELIAARVRAGRIVEGHGDLRPEHVYLVERPVVIDRLEFDGTLLALDPLSDLTFIAFECERLDAPWVGAHILRRTCALTGDEPDPRLVRFYRLQHACARAKLAIWRLEDPGPRGTEAWRAKARDVLHRAIDTSSI
jgi:uncharacterized protein